MRIQIEGQTNCELKVRLVFDNDTERPPKVDLEVLRAMSAIAAVYDYVEPTGRYNLVLHLPAPCQS